LKRRDHIKKLAVSNPELRLNLSLKNGRQSPEYAKTCNGSVRPVNQNLAFWDCPERDTETDKNREERGGLEKRYIGESEPLGKAKAWLAKNEQVECPAADLSLFAIDSRLAMR
jgi:hypothetical protein